MNLEQDNLPDTTGGSGLAVASLVLGILSIPLLGIGAVLGLLAIVLGSISIRKSGVDKKATAGIVTGIVGLVVAIATFAIYMVVPYIQAANRDSARKTDASTIVSDIISHRTNNKGKMPTKYQLHTSHLSQISEIKQTSYGGYEYDGDPKPTLDTATYRIGENCKGETRPTNFTISIQLNDGSVYCAGS